MRIIDSAGAPPPVDGGWALSEWARSRGLTHLPLSPRNAPATCYIDAWTPPHRLALESDTCDQLQALAAMVHPSPSGNGTYYFLTIPPTLLDPILERFEEANRMWWRLDVDEWDAGLKRYRPDEQLPVHQDMHPTSQRRKIAGVVQLSDAGDYTGGALVASFAGERAEMPRDRGTLVTFPGWTNHGVEAVTSGVRWSLCVNAWGPPIR